MLDCKDRRHSPKSPLSRIGSYQHCIDHVPPSAVVTIVVAQTRELARAGSVLAILQGLSCLVLYRAIDLDMIHNIKVRQYDGVMVCSKQYLNDSERDPKSFCALQRIEC